MRLAVAVICVVLAMMTIAVPATAQLGWLEVPCTVAADPEWSEPEQWAWQRICAGKVADFNERYRNRPDLRGSDGWTEQRALRSAFFKTLLLDEPYRGALTHRGVHLIGAWFPEPVDLKNTSVGFELRLEDSRFESWVAFDRARLDRSLSLNGSALAGTLFLDLTEIAGNLEVNGARFNEVSLVGAAVRGRLAMDGVRSGGGIDMERIDVGGSLFLRGGTFNEVRLLGAKIAGSVELHASRFAGTLSMDAIDIGEFLLARDGAAFNELRLPGARIGRLVDLNGASASGWLSMEAIDIDGPLRMADGGRFQGVTISKGRIAGDVDMWRSSIAGLLNLEGITIDGSLLLREGRFDEVLLRMAKVDGQITLIGAGFTGRLDMDSIEVGEHILAPNAWFEDGANWTLIFARVGAGLLVAGSQVNSIDLTSAVIGGELAVGRTTERCTLWLDGSKLTLRNASARVIQDLPDSWPRTLDLEGFTYTSFGGFGATIKVEPEREGSGCTPASDEPANPAQRTSQWFVDWLARDPNYSRQPYEQLAKVLREGGQVEKADDVLYAGRERQRTQVASGLDFAWQTVLHAFIGHGYRAYRALWWVVGFVVLGAAVLRVSGEGPRNRMPIGLAYSFDRLLPIVQLRKYHYDVDLKGWARYYFYVHQLMGYVLASFLIAGLSGLTK